MANKTGKGYKTYAPDKAAEKKAADKAAASDLQE